MAVTKSVKKIVVSDKRFSRLLQIYPYLYRYIESISNSVGIPTFYDTYELSYDLKKIRNVNIVYPLGEGIFIHVYMPPQGTVSGYRKYVAIEPPKPDPRLMEMLEIRLAELITEKDVSEDVEERKKVILSKLDKIVRVVDTPVDYGKIKNNSRYIPVYRPELEYLRYHILREKVGLGILEPFIRDPWLEDITCKGSGYIYVVHKIFSSLETNIEFKTEEELDTFVIKLAERIGKPVSHARPIVDATLPDGSRINIVYGSDVSLHGSNFTIRKFAKVPISVTQLIAWNTFDEKIAAYLWMLLNNSMSGFICGETASGKTTTLNAIAVFIPPTSKIVSIEDTAEVQFPHPNWVRELTRDTGSKESSVTMFDLLRAALRQRPNYIIVGEIRGVEASIAFQAMQTGHPVLSTFHAASVERVVQRLTGDPINIPKTFMDNLNFVLIQSAVWREGVMVRRVLSVNEIIGYDPKADAIIYVPVFVWDPVRDRFVFRGRGASHLLEEKIAVMRGISRVNMKKIYDELDLRAQFLRTLVEKKIFNYFDVWKAIVKTYELGIETALRRLERGSLL
ncbi:type II secretion system protein E [Ignisphaera aggregans DSM 17230]|uniref:Type II secretion system protein E n=1 Tax=Ignisphaera aggregans (strain DSM 17230 / JCM 13409 / AQ1.S1) TaxID=583356 RepID=E0SRR2_IGNAA|nr:type II secretion system protein E [Ignisphaera aggregans DSM 17230]